jgi:uncharacterized membrane protein YkvA (DUF1232 family)
MGVLSVATRARAIRGLYRTSRASRRAGSPGFRERMRVFPRMVFGSLRGTYPGLSRGRLALMALALVYVISPIDLVPELALALLGLGDDVFVLGWLVGTALDETEQFIIWQGRDRVVPGEVAP